MNLSGPRIHRRVFLGFLAFGLLVGIGVRSGFAQEKISLSELVGALQKGSDRTDKVTLVWWAPQEYWRATFSQDPIISQAQADEIVNFLRPYTIFFVVDGSMGKFGAVDYKSESEIRANIQVSDNQGVLYHPLSEDEVNQNAKDFLLMMKPVFASMIGPMGQNMHAIVFPGKDAKGQPIADAKKEGNFSVKLYEGEFKWRLPLGVLLPEKICPQDGEKMNGAWKFCPWHGVALTESKQ